MVLLAIVIRMFRFREHRSDSFCYLVYCYVTGKSNPSRSDMSAITTLVGTLTAELSSLFLMCYLASESMRYTKKEVNDHLQRLERIVNAGSKIRGDKIAEKCVFAVGV